MEIKNNNELNMFEGIPQHNTILNWFAEVDEEVKNKIKKLQSKLTKAQLKNCQNGKAFESETERAEVSFDISNEKDLQEDDDWDLELDYETESMNYGLYVCPFKQEVLDSIEEESEIEKSKNGHFAYLVVEIASLSIENYNDDSELEYTLTLHKIDGEIYVFLDKSISDETVGEPKKLHIPQKELEEYFNQNTKNL